MWTILGGERVEARGEVGCPTPGHHDDGGAGFRAGHLGENSGVPELVVIAEQLLAPVPGGTGRYTAELLPALARTAPPGWTVSSVVARHADVSAARIEGVEGPRVLPLPPRALVALWQLGLRWWPGGDAVHAPTPFAPPRPPAGRTLTVTVHDTVPWTHPETLTARGVSWHRSMIARAARRSSGLIVPTRAVADELAVLLDVDVPVRVVPHGVTVPEGAAQLDLPSRYVLAVGTIEPRKGMDVLVDAVAQLDGTDEAGDVGLVLAGQPGWGGIDPVRLAADRGLKSVRVLGKVTDAQLATALRGASVLAVPSLAEGFGLPLLEAMAIGVPVVHTDVPALVEVSGGAGLVVPRGDADALARALKEVLLSPDKAAELSKLGRERARTFTWRAAAEAVWAAHRRAG
ncbi:Glycosyltransferase involved in cell wall bisynthesis [Amycolatopsis rubida]|uniref:Glycosyltransferase involved in cell wall bisynthesis n=1 Tax=Amycolatopsis rubida TaxID=112413 RepID=A0A1I5XUS3_9PSEU|nr:Glycosyltransferase involved in cell wall bisynthesis [Amycolatopsis rubida]